MISELPEPLSELRALIRDRKVTKKLFESESFDALWVRVKDHLDDDDPAIFWVTLSTLGRMSAVSKPAERLVKPLLKQRLDTRLPYPM